MWWNGRAHLQHFFTTGVEVAWGKHLGKYWPLSWQSSFITEGHFSWRNDSQKNCGNSDLSTWPPRRPIAWRKTIDSFGTGDKIRACRWKLEFWKTCICHHELGSFAILAHFSDEITGEVKECEVFILQNEIRQQPQGAAQLSRPIFPPNQCMLL